MKPCFCWHWSLALALATAEPFAQTGTQQPPPQPPPQPPTPAGRTARLRRAGRRHGVEGRAAARQRAGDGVGGHRRRDRSRRRRPTTRSCSGRCPGVNISQTSARDFNITMRGATSTLATSHAGAARRPQPLSRLLRLRRVGPAAGESQRAQADRSDPRSGVGRVGRQRDERRRQLHLEDAARARTATARR